jgi:Alpha-kinase family
MTFHAVDDCQGPITGSLIFNPNAPSNFGSFKKATMGHTNCRVVGSSVSVCIKQCWYRAHPGGPRLAYDSATQVMKLSAELNCLRWASALMNLVYDFMNKYIKSHRPPTFKIPQMRFVHTALAILDNETHDTYMIEEAINDAMDGEFVKYIGNSSAKPLTFLDRDMANRAAFLSFSQHVQYAKTQQLAFIRDFQGQFNRTNCDLRSIHRFCSTRWKGVTN